MPRDVFEQREKHFTEQLAEMPVEYLVCHYLGHQGRPATLDTKDGLYVGLLCISCDMEIESYRDPYTYEVKRRYWHPRGDYNFRGTGPVTKEMKYRIGEAWAIASDLPSGERPEREQ